MGNTDASTWVMLPPAVARLGSWPVSETTCVDDFFMATPVAVLRRQRAVVRVQDSRRGRCFRARYGRPWCRLALMAGRQERGEGAGVWAGTRVDTRCHARA